MTLRELLRSILATEVDLDQEANLRILRREPEGYSVTHHRFVPISRWSGCTEFPAICVEETSLNIAEWKMRP